MRLPKYLSPSALFQYRKDKKEYFRRYCCDYKPPKIQQTPAMAVGSAFDAFVKSYLYAEFGRPKTAEEAQKYERQRLFDSQVEIQNRQVVWEYGEHLFEMYKSSGALGDLMMDLRKAIDEPRFEIDLQGTVTGPSGGSGEGNMGSSTGGQPSVSDKGIERHINGVVLLGKPDIRFINSEAAHVIQDWKVNGFLSKSPVSPKPGYVQLRECDEHGGWIRRGPHKDAMIGPRFGMMLNSTKLEYVDEDWAAQLATYGWLLGSTPGQELVVGIEQFCGNKNSLRLASHRTTIGRQFQLNLLNEYIDLWNILHDPKGCYFFRDMSRDDSLREQDSIEKQVKMMSETTDSTARWILDESRQGPRW